MMKLSDDRADSLRRLFATRATEVETDSAGRICLPEDVARAVDVKDRVVLAGMLEWFEIWSPERYAQVEAGDNERASDAFALI
jgi:MraZ protein